MILVLYEDDGPEGICGQSADITAPWKKLVEIDEPDTAHAMLCMSPKVLSVYLGFCGTSGTRGRRNARITHVFTDNEDAADMLGYSVNVVRK